MKAVRDRAMEDRRKPDHPSGRREGHNVAPGEKVKGKVAYTEDRRATGLSGARVRQRRGGRWRTTDRRIEERRWKKVMKNSTAGTFQHPLHGTAYERRSRGLTSGRRAKGRRKDDK